MNSRLAPRRFAAPGALLLAVSLALVGCGQGEGADAGPRAQIGERLMGLYVGDDNRRLNHNLYENVVKACMEEQGFEYSPEPVHQDSELSYLVRSEDDAKENGYGVTPASKEALIERYSYSHLGERPDDQTGGEDRDSWPYDDFAASWPDDENTGAGFTEEAFGLGSNDAYYSSLSATRQAAYDEALRGPSAKNSPNTQYDWKTAGCYGQANHEVYQDRVPDLQAHLDSTVIHDYSTYVIDKTTRDPRQLAAEAAWASCMADKGYDFGDPEEAQASIRQRLGDLTNDDFSDENLGQVPEEELVALHADEIATATDDAGCTVDTGLEDVTEEVYIDAETEFYNTHEAEVEAWFTAEEALRG